jgi:hypothetical protein
MKHLMQLITVLLLVSCNEKGELDQRVFLEEELLLSIDLTSNTASGVIHLANRNDREISLSLSAADFKSETTRSGLNSKVVRLCIALIVAIIGLLSGAVDPAGKARFICADIAVFLRGFGAIKNLIAPKQAPK